MAADKDVTEDGGLRRGGGDAAPRLAAFRYRLWWIWARFRLGSDVLAAAGYRPPGERGGDG